MNATTAVSTTTAARQVPPSIKDIPLGKIRESQTNPRRRFDETKLAELADNIKQYGVLQPILVRPAASAAGSLLTGKAISHKANITASKSYYPHSDFRFDTKTFTELKNAQAVVIAYDGLNPMPPAFCYLKPYYNDPNKTYFRQLEEGQL